MLEVFILAVALSMDAFAVSIGLGSKRFESIKFLSFLAASYFGLFQALMPLLGYLGGKEILGWLQGYSHWVAFALLIFIGGKMIYESFSEGAEESISRINHKVMITLAFATSIDALAAGFTLNLLEVDAFIACLIIGAVTFLFSGLGVFIGSRSGTWLESKAELLGGFILIAIGFKTLIFN